MTFAAQVPANLFPRWVKKHIETALQDTPVVMINGPRQCGKTTLVQSLTPDYLYLTLDEKTILDSARLDPVGFIRKLDRAVIDEIQYVPELFQAIKMMVDQDRRPGRFLLTGSANILALPQASDSLAGRMEIITLLPLSQAEIQSYPATFIAQAFEGDILQPGTLLMGHELIGAALSGGYPEMVKRSDPIRQRAWARSYIQALVQRDLKEIADIEKLDKVPHLLRALAHYSGHLTNFTQLGGQLGLDAKTTQKYTGFLEHIFLIRRVQPWFRNSLNWLIKTPKLYFYDSGLLAALSGLTPPRVMADRFLAGALLETFVFSEIIKQITISEEGWHLFHYRDKDKNEVDFVVENDLGECIGIEVKAAATVTSSDFNGLRKLQEAIGSDFKCGIVVYDGERVLPFGERLFAAPISALWG